MEKFEVTAIRRGIRGKEDNWITEEVPLTIEVNGKELATLLSSPRDLKDLVAGFLFTSGLIEGIDPVKMTIDEERWKASAVIPEGGLPEGVVFRRIYTSGCGRGVIFHNPFDLMQRTEIPFNFSVPAQRVSEVMKTFLKGSPEYRETGGVHSGALANGGEILIFKEDIGRHNTLDKVIGEALSRKVDFSDKIMLTTGRISSEIMSKILRCRVPVLVARGAPTNQAVKLAKEINLTLVGFARGMKMTVFSGEERIT
ncbi:MAG: formate dehydrogenase accessory sulfurtransferase FdhD [Syntrophales bacterium]|nr:formate dehydrogenase accessory sulfurtransferase FdhD [Syntrophales bacterium]